MKGSLTWYHLSHCAKTREGEVPRLQRHDVVGPREPSAAPEEQKDLDGSHQLEDVVDDSVCPSLDNGENSSLQHQGKKFEVVDLQHAPVAVVEFISRDKHQTPEKSQDTRKSRDIADARSSRPIRTRTRPKRYEA